MMYVFLFIFGLCVGSFLNVVIDRIPHHISILKGRSHCDTCKHVLTWYDLLPIFSFLFLRGRCRYCQTKLSWQYPLIEFLTGLFFITTYMLTPLSLPLNSVDLLHFVLMVCIWSAFFALSIMDYKYGILADKIVLFSLIITCILLLLQPSLIFSHFLSGFITLLFFFLLFLITKAKGIGFGDVKISFVIGLLLGYPAIIIAIYLAFLTGGFIALILVIAKKKKLVGGTIAFGPFLLFGTYISWYFGNSLWILLLHLLGIV